MNNRTLYYSNLSRKYGDGNSIPHNTPQAPRMTPHKINLLKQGLPLTLPNGTIKVSDRGDILFINLVGESSHFVNTPDELL
jgi:hypothetical protein